MVEEIGLKMNNLKKKILVGNLNFLPIVGDGILPIKISWPILSH
jgi:hypothetical protein